MKNFKESKLQQQCVAWFRGQYPQYAMLMTHVANEGGRNTAVIGGIHKAEGTVAGVPDLLLFMPSHHSSEEPIYYGTYHGLGIEMKTEKGRQNQVQKDYQRMFESAGYKYVIVRDFDTFRKEVNDYIAHVFQRLRRNIASAHVEIEQEAREREVARFKKFLKKAE